MVRLGTKPHLHPRCWSTLSRVLLLGLQVCYGTLLALPPRLASHHGHPNLALNLRMWSICSLVGLEVFLDVCGTSLNSSNSKMAGGRHIYSLTNQTIRLELLCLLLRRHRNIWPESVGSTGLSKHSCICWVSDGWRSRHRIVWRITPTEHRIIRSWGSLFFCASNADVITPTH